MKIYLDECVDWSFARAIINHDVISARQMGWTGLKNGALLALVSAQFDAFVTVDRNLAFQQNIPALTLAVLILKARTNRLADLMTLAPNLAMALDAARPGAVTIVELTSQ